MRFSSVKLALLASLAAFGHAEDDACNNKDAPFAPSRQVGLEGNSVFAGSYYCNTEWRTGNTIIGVEAWSSLWAVEGIKFKYATGEWTQWYGTNPEHGDKRVQVEKVWGAGEPVKIMLYKNSGQADIRTAIGKIQIFKDDESILDVWATKDKAYDKVPAEFDQGAGIILGVEVRALNSISNLEFKMLKSKVIDTTLTDIKLAESLKDWTEKQKGIQNVGLSSVYFRNDNEPGGPNMTFKFANTVTKKTSKTITTENKQTFGLGVEVKQKIEAGVPGVASTSTEFTYKANYEFSHMTSDAMTEANDQALNWEMASGATANMLAPGKATHCTAWVLSGKFDSEYTGTIQAKLADGDTFNYSTKGKVSSVSYLDAQAKCEEMNVKDIPGGADSQPGDVINGPGINKRAVVYRG